MHGLPPSGRAACVMSGQIRRCRVAKRARPYRAGQRIPERMGVRRYYYAHMRRTFCAILVLVSCASAPALEFKDTSQRERVDCAVIAKGTTAVILAFGQSNAASHGGISFNPTGPVYSFNFYDGHCYHAADPLLATTYDPDRGSVWTRLGQLLVDRHAFDAVLLAPIAVGGSFVAQWKPGGENNPRINVTIEQLRRHGIEITHMVWAQGEAEAAFKPDKVAYKTDFEAMLVGIRQLGVSAPIYVAISTLCHSPEMFEHPKRVSAGERAKLQRGQDEIRQAQHELINPAAGIFAGPDTDMLGLDLRRDECHFSDEGLDRAAELWLAALLTNPPQH
jgi:Carbohydrate esterase, sialic acid-specific acetylesterase